MSKKPLITRIRNWIEHRRYKRAMKVLARHILYNSTPLTHDYLMSFGLKPKDITLSWGGGRCQKIDTKERFDVLYKIVLEQDIHKLAK